MIRHVLVVLMAVALIRSEMLADESPQQTQIARQRPAVRVYNPTDWDGPVVIQVPVGHLAAPGLIDWGTRRLVAEGGGDVPYAIREGRPHWKASLKDPVTRPRPEDLLTFSATVKPHTWSRFEVVPNEEDVRVECLGLFDQGEIVHGDLRAVVAADTGMLQQITWLGEPLLDRPLAVKFSRSSASSPDAQPLSAPHVSFAGSTSTEAMTALHYVLTADRQLSMAVSYYFYASGVIEIWIDERSWQEPSPWVDHVATIDWPIKGAVEALPWLENRAPFYGFKDYATAVRHVANVRRLEKAVVVEMGEETSNGRRWMRRIFCVPPDRTDRIPDLVEAADEGMIVELEPMELSMPAGQRIVTCPAGAELAAQRLSDVWCAKGESLTTVTEDDAKSDARRAAVTLHLATPSEAPDIEGDGFTIHPDAEGQTVTIIARTPFGLHTAARQVARHAARSSDADIRMPLIAGNPAVSLRAGGFGGGDFEVDFPHGSDDQWDAALDGLAASGMNVMADLGMWSNWKMPVSYRDMPELQSSDPNAYDEVSGAKLSELDLHRRRGLRLLQFLHERGVKVWLWLPVGCVPTTYAQQHPDAMAPGKPACPCFTHPLYNRYLEAFLTELLETYPIDGIVMIRDDNGGLCPCERCKQYVEQSVTKSAAWEQYLILYRWLRGHDFRGDVAVYPYWDYYEPRLDPALPADLLVVGHGSGATVLARHYERSLPMGDTWLDNVFASFRVAATPRMRRLLADRNAFWIGGALRGSELPWQSIGRFGWEPTATVNTFRFEWAAQQFGADRAIPAVTLLNTYEELWDLYDLPMLPHEWMKLSPLERQATSERGRQLLSKFRARLSAVRASDTDAATDAWFRHVDLFGVYFEYLLRRLELFVKMHELAVQHKPAVDQGDALAESVRTELLGAHREIYALAERYDAQMAEVPGDMLARTRALGLTRPFKEFVAGWDPSLDGVLQVKQFTGTVSAVPEKLTAGAPFVLRLRLRNLGVCPWQEGVGHQLELSGDVATLQLPATWDFTGAPLVLGDQRDIELHGVAPREPGEASIHLRLTAPFRNVYPMAEGDVVLRWE